MFKALSKHGLVINRSKCEVGRSELDFLGHRLSAQGVAPLPERVQAINSFRQPTTINSLQRYLGMVNFYRRFLPRIAHTLRPLTDALTNSPKVLHWTNHMTKAFTDSKLALAKATLLAHHVRGAKLWLSTDASTKAIAAVLEQSIDGSQTPIAFFSRRTSTAESRYSAFDLELLALYIGIVHFRHHLEGRNFEVFVDQKPLTRSFFGVRDPISNRQRNQLSLISEFCTDLSHVPGVDNVVADALTRQFDKETAIVNTISHRLSDGDLEALACLQEEETDNEFDRSSLVVRPFTLPGSSTSILCDASTTPPRIIVPQYFSNSA